MRPPLAALRAFAAAPVLRVERCERCGATLPPRHAHLLDVERQHLSCACPACAVAPAASGAGLRAVERRVERLAGDALEPAAWTALGVPVGLAWLTRGSGAAGWQVRMPGALGPVAWRLDDAALAETVARLPAIAADVEALLVRRRPEGTELFRVSIDLCFELAGLLRSSWQGFGGGAAHAEVDRFFTTLARESR